MSSINVASWPGYGVTHNPFIGLFLKGLETAGCSITSLDNIEACGTTKADILLIHWPELAFGEARSKHQMIQKPLALISALARRPTTVKVVWLVHNIEPHDAKRLSRVIWPVYVKALARQTDAFMTLSPGTVAQVRTVLPGLARKPALGLWHPAYPGARLSADERSAARRAMGWNGAERVLGYCGQIRPYKGVEELIAAFRQIANPDLRLFLAGRTRTPEYATLLKTTAASDPRIVLQLGDLSPEAFRTALGVCDVTVAPIRSYLHSGSIVHALSAGRPVLTPETPFSAALQDLLGADWLRLYDGTMTPYLLEAATSVAQPAHGPDLSAMEPALVGADAAKFFEALANETDP